jgi:hypothetical protein
MATSESALNSLTGVPYKKKLFNELISLVSAIVNLYPIAMI